MKPSASILKFLLFAVPAFQVPAVSFESAGYAEYGAEFLKLSRNAQAAGLGNAVTAWQDDLAGVQFNPALLSAAGSYQASLTYTSLSVDRVNNGLDFAGPLFKGLVLGVSATQYGVRDILEADCVDDNDCSYGKTNGKLFDENEYSFDAALAGRIPGYLSYGVRSRYIYQKVGDFGDGMAHGFGIDLGLFYSPWTNINIGISCLNLGSKLWWETGRADWVAPSVRVGVAGIFVDSVLQLEADLMQPGGQPMEGMFGAQVKIFKILALRTGISSAVRIEEGNNLDFMEPELFMGLGIRYSWFGVDYAAMKPGSPFGLGHKFTLLVRFPEVFN